MWGFLFHVCLLSGNGSIGVIYGMEKTPQDRIIERLESEIERLKLELFEVKGELKLNKKLLKEATASNQEMQGYDDDDGNYVEP